ncbi:TraK family protein [Oxalobacteraceae bacterium A2-2]
MAKSYPQELAEWVQGRPAARHARNHVAFLAVRDDVQQALDAGYARKTIWSNLVEGGRIDFGYDIFLRYVRLLCVRPEKARKGASLTFRQTAGKQGVPPQPMRQADRTPPTKDGSLPGFVFNPAPNKEELI